MKQERNSFLTDAAEIKMKGNLRLYKKCAESVNSCCLNMAKLLIFKFSYIEQVFCTGVCGRACIFMIYLF